MLLPDHETEVDFLNYEAIAKTVAALLNHNRQRALTIGIHGDWGAGKSSVLKMIEAEIKDGEKVACLWFNGWAFQGFDDAKTVLIEETINELCLCILILGLQGDDGHKPVSSRFAPLVAMMQATDSG